MKKFIKISATIVLLLISIIIIAQPLPYDPGIGGGSGNAPVGGGAPLGEGLIVLLSMGICYGVKKWKMQRTKSK